MGLYFFYGKGKKIIKWEQDFVRHRIDSAIKRVEFYIYGSVHRESNLITVQQDAT